MEIDKPSRQVFEIHAHAALAEAHRDTKARSDGIGARDRRITGPGDRSEAGRKLTFYPHALLHKVIVMKKDPIIVALMVFTSQG